MKHRKRRKKRERNFSEKYLEREERERMKDEVSQKKNSMKMAVDQQTKGRKENIPPKRKISKESPA